MGLLLVTRSNGHHPNGGAPGPPDHHDAATEEAYLGALLASGDQTLLELVRPQDFYSRRREDIYLAATALATRGDSIDPTTVAYQLAEHPPREAWDRSDAIITCIDLTQAVPVITNAPLYAANLRELGHRRRINHLAGALYLGETSDTTSLAAALNDLPTPEETPTETWRQFRTTATDDMPMLIRDLWPRGAFGFVAAPPKARKTWLALSLAIAVSSGRPFLGRHAIPQPEPVLYVALEGHRAALRARIGCLTRGYNLDPDTDQPALLHLWYKPRGINLADPTWARKLARQARLINAQLVIIDVLRSAARIKENDASEFASLHANLRPISDSGCAICLLHHFVKHSETSKERTAGERMSGSGAMYGALDFGIYITTPRTKKNEPSSVEIQGRELADPDPFTFHLDGVPSGPNGGFTYQDRLVLQVDETPQAVPSNYEKGDPLEIREWIEEHGGVALSGEIRDAFGLDPRTLIRRRPELALIGVRFVPAGPQSHYTTDEMQSGL